MKLKNKNLWALSLYEKILRENNLIFWVQLPNEFYVSEIRHKLIGTGLSSVMVNTKVLSLLEVFKMYTMMRGGCSLFIYSQVLSLEKIEYLTKLEQDEIFLVLLCSANKVNFIKSSSLLTYYRKSQSFLALESRASVICVFSYEMLLKYFHFLRLMLFSLKLFSKEVVTKD
jgi:hypothetical protein